VFVHFWEMGGLERLNLRQIFRIPFHKLARFYHMHSNTCPFARLRHSEQTRFLEVFWSPRGGSFVLRVIPESLNLTHPSLDIQRALPRTWTVSMEDPVEVYNGLDDETARLALQLQATELSDSVNPGAADAAAAIRLYLEDLQVYADIRDLNIDLGIKVYECCVCASEFSAAHCLLGPCNEHRYCDGCLGRLYSDCMTDQNLYPPRCCRLVIPWDSASALLSDGLRTEFEARREELDDSKKLYCHASTCSAYVPHGKREDSIGICQQCDVKTCTICTQGTHEGDCPEDEALKQTRAWGDEVGAQRCTQCRNLVQLAHGCNHMTCRCGHQFCYLCNANWKTCECLLLTEENLEERVGEVANRPGGDANDAGAIADQLRADHDHPVHTWVYTPGGAHCEECGDLIGCSSFVVRGAMCRSAGGVG
jgi:hypothetical protein